MCATGLFMICLAVTALESTGQTDIENLIDHVDQVTNATQNYDIRLKLRKETYLPSIQGNGPSKAVVSEYSIRDVFSQGEGRAVESLDNSTGVTTQTWRRQPSERDLRQHRAAPLSVGIGSDYLLLTRPIVHNEDFIALLRKHLISGTLELTNEGHLIRLQIALKGLADFRESSLVKNRDKNLGDPVGVRVWIDPSRDYMPVKLEIFVNENGKERLVSRTTVELKMIERGLWVPIACNKETYEVSFRRPQSLISRSSLQVDLSTSKWNAEKVDLAFLSSVGQSSGTDHMTIKRPDGRTIDMGIPPEQKIEAANFRILFLAGNVAFILLVVAILLFRRWRHIRSLIATQ